MNFNAFDSRFADDLLEPLVVADDGDVRSTRSVGEVEALVRGGRVERSRRRSPTGRRRSVATMLDRQPSADQLRDVQKIGDQL